MPRAASGDEWMRASPGRMVLFASGDFACNLFWQSTALYLFFFYTDVLRLPPATAGWLTLVGAIWDGLADIGVGVAAQRMRGDYRPLVTGGAVPLGLAFVMVYLAPTLPFVAPALAALAAQLVFRTLYALVNIPYAALSVRISSDPRDRAAIAGLRMLFGAAAATLVAFATQPIAGMASGSRLGANGFAAAALVFAVPAVALLLTVGRAAGEPHPPVCAQAAGRPALGAALAALARHRGFVALNLAMAAVAAAAAMLTRSVLYYFTYNLAAPRAGSTTLAMMGVAGTLAVPGWTIAGRRWGARRCWLAATGIGVAVLACYAIVAPVGVIAAQAMLVAMQGVLMAFNIGFWAMLPGLVDDRGTRHGRHAEPLAFGVAALVQKLALGAAAGLFGLTYQAIGYVADAPQRATALAGIRWAMLAYPAAGLALSAAAMLAMRGGERRSGGQ